MPKTTDYITHEVFEITGLWIFGLLMSFILPIAIGFGGKAFEGGILGEVMSKFMFYYIFIIGGTILLTVLKIREIWLNRKSKKITKVSAFSTAIVHDPDEESFLMKVAPKFFSWLRNPVRVFVLSLIVFSIVGLIGALTNTFFAGIPQTQFQVSTTGQVFFSAEPASWGETITFIALLSIQYGLIYWLSKKYRVNPIIFWVLALIILPFLVGLEWMGLHSLRYGSSDVSLLAVFLFGYIGTWITLLTGSFIPWYVWHLCNNSFFQLNLLFSNESILIWTIIVIFMLAIGWVGVELWNKSRKRKYGRNDVSYVGG